MLRQRAEVTMISQLAFATTGHRSARTILGAAAFGRTTQDETDRTIALALECGVNHIDTAASYGESELRVGSWIKRHGKSFFLATKTGERTRAAASDQIRRSLEKLEVDQLDLIQLHNLVEPEQWQAALGPGGALEAAIEARDAGLVRFIGVTGHGLFAPRMHRQALDRFAFDAVLFPVSYILSQNAEYWADAQALMRVCRERKVAMQTIKAIVRAPWGERPQAGPTWYEPLQEQSEIDLAVHWLLGQPDLFLNTVGDIALIPKVLDAAARFRAAPPAAELSAQLGRLGMAPLFTQPWL
jgi:predicted aldo/keto reductase-like oxidoreductase